MDSNSSSGSQPIDWGPWTRLPNGQWTREGQDSLGNWYQDNQDVDPRDPRPLGPMGDFTSDFGNLELDSSLDASYPYQGHEISYGGYNQVTSMPVSQDSLSGNYPRSRHKGKSRHAENSQQSESSRRDQHRSKSSRQSKGDSNGHDMSMRPSTTVAKGSVRDMEQQTTPGPDSDHGESSKDSSHSSIGHIVERRPAGIDAATGKPSTDGNTNDTTASKEGIQAQLDPRLDELTVSDDITNGISSYTKAAEVDNIRHGSLSHRPQPPVSSICVTEAFSNTSAIVSHLAVLTRQRIIQLLIADVWSILQTSSQFRNAVNIGHIPTSSDHTRSNPTTSTTGNEATQSNSSEGQHTTPENENEGSQQPDGEGSAGEDGNDEDGNDEDGNDEDGDGKDGDDSDGDRKSRLKKKKKRLFACPYVKHNKSLYGPKSFCNGHGWPNVFRIKEHLYRRHRQALHCARCQTKFEELGALDAHSRKQMPCELSQITTLEGFSKAQEEELRSRKGLKHLNERQKWEKIYQILFPHENKIPSPYYDPDDLCLSTYFKKVYPPLIAKRLLEDTNAIREEYTQSQLENDIRALFNEHVDGSLRNAHKRQRVGVSSEVGSRTLLRQSNQQAETSSSTSTADVSLLDPVMAISNDCSTQAPALPTHTLAAQNASNPIDFGRDGMAGLDFQLEMVISTNTLGFEHSSKADQQQLCVDMNNTQTTALCGEAASVAFEDSSPAMHAFNGPPIPRALSGTTEGSGERPYGRAEPPFPETDPVMGLLNYQDDIWDDAFQPNFFEGNAFDLDSMQDREHDDSTGDELGECDDTAQ